MNRIDKDEAKNAFSVDAFLALISRLDLKSDSYDELLDAMKIIAQNQDRISIEEFKATLQEQGETMENSEIEEIIKDLDTEHDNKISIEAFAKLIYN